jgi:hypothetical protein
MNGTADALLVPVTIATAPEASQATFEGIPKSFGFIPNLMTIFATNPAVLHGKK